MNPYREPGKPTSRLKQFFIDRTRVLWPTVVILAALSSIAATASLRLNGIRYPDGTGSPGGFFNAKSPEWGCVADGTTDDTPCFNAMVTAAAVKGGTIYLPASNGERYTLTSTVVISSIYPVNIISDMHGFADNQTTGAFIHPGANFGATPMIKYIAPGGSHSAQHGAGLLRGLVFYDNFNGNHTPNYTMSMALDLQDFNFGRIENCMFQVLNGGAIRSVYWIMGSMRNVVIRYSGTVTQAALSLESFSASVTAQSTTIDNVKLEVNYGTYLKLDANVTEVKLAHLGFEADTSTASTCNTFIDNSGQQIQFHNIHMNRNTVAQWVNQSGTNFTIASDITILGNASQTSTCMTIGGSNHVFDGITLRNVSAQTTYGITVTAAETILSNVNIKASGGIGISGNAYVKVIGAIIDAPPVGAGTSAIDVGSSHSKVIGAIIKTLPANMNGIRLTGSVSNTSVMSCEVRDQNTSGAAFVDNNSANNSIWVGNSGFNNTVDWSATATSYFASGNQITGINVQTMAPLAVGSAIASASTIAPTAPVHHITGTTTIQTISHPTPIAQSGTGGQVTLIFDAVAPWNAAGNILVAGTPTTAGTSVTFTYDNGTARWYPSRTL